MTFTIDIEIDRPLDHVWEAFTDRSLMARWQTTLRAVEPISGNPGEIGTVTRLTYREAGRDVVMDETVVECEKPTSLVCNLSSSMMGSTLANRFTSLAGGRTRWVVHCDIRFRGLWKLLGLFGRRMIVRKTRFDMERFKQLVESSARESTGKQME